MLLPHPAPRATTTSPDPEPAMTHLPTLVLAARGKTGRRVADRLEAAGHPVRRASRTGATPETTFDWDDRATWRAALAGAGAAYVVYTPDLAVPAAPGAIAAFVELAEELGLGRLVLLSGRGEEEAQAAERLVLDSSIPSTVVRASWFNQNFDEGEFRELVLSGQVALPVGEVGEPFLDVDDLADVAVLALTEAGHAGEVHELTGPCLLTFAEVVAELAAATGRELTFTRIPRDAFRKGLTEAGMPSEQLELLDYLFTTVLDGRNAQVTDDVERVLGRPAKDFRTWAREAAAAKAWDHATQEA